MHRTISRRAVLRGTGVSLALPMLESMRPVVAAAETTPKRSVFICTALGLHPNSLWPKAPGKDYESTKYLQLLDDHRDDFTLFSGLQHQDQTGRQPHDSEMTFLTAARKPGMGGFRNTISVDQLAASAVGSQTRFPSITLGTMKPQSQSYTRGGVMIPAQTSPAQLFAQLFLNGKPEEVQRQKQKLDDGKSILDELGSQAKRLKQSSGAADSHLLTDYFDSIREAERNIQSVQSWMDRPKPKVDASQPRDILDPSDMIGRAKLLMDLIPLIVQTDSSRVITVMIQDHFVVPKVEGVTGNHHNLSHHGQDPAKIAQLAKIETEILQCFGGLLEKLKAKTENGSRLLDGTAVLFGSNLGNANAHAADNLPIFLAGGGYEHSGYVARQKGTPLCNLYVSLLHRMGLEVDTFAQSTGALI